jgi:glycosyltransferase involved in cell wall biosynthesis
MRRSCLLHISANRYPPFPAMHHTRRIWEELARGFGEYHVLARGESNKYVHSIDGNIHLHLLPAFGRRGWVFFFLSWALPWFVIRYRPTHLLAQCPVFGGLAAAFSAILFRVPLFVELHGTHYFKPLRSGLLSACSFRFYRLFSSFTFRSAARIRTLSDHMSDVLIAVYGERFRHKVVVIPTRVDLSIFKNVKVDYSVGEKLRIITVGSYISVKNHCGLIQDIHRLKLSCSLTIAGSGPLADEYRCLAERLGTASLLTLTGNLDQKELSALLAAHDIYVHYSLSEALSRAILEAMACGLPVVATNVGYIHGVLQNGKNALVLEKPYADNLAVAIRDLSLSEDMRRGLGREARKTIEERFEWNQVFERYRQAILTMPGILT